MRKRVAGHHVAQELHIGVQADDMGLGECRIHARQRLGAGASVHDEFGDHGVVIRADGVTLAHTRVHTHAVVGPGKAAVRGQGVHTERAGGGQKLFVRRLSTNARLNRVAGDLQLVLAQGQRLAAGHAQLPLHQIKTGDGFRHRMLHLQARVHLHKVEGPHACHFVCCAAPRGGRRALGRPGSALLHGLGPVVAGLFHNKFHSARTHVVHRAGRSHSRRAHLRAQGLGHAGGGGFFEHLLVATLHRAIALKQINVIALAVAKDLDLNVARALHVFFNQHGAVAKAAYGLALAAGQGGGKVAGRLDNAHALAATARAGFDQHGVANAVGLALQKRRVLVGAVVAGHQRYASALHQLLGFGLQTHGANGAGRWANKGQPGVGAGLRKGIVLAQKAITRMNGLRARGQRSVDDGLPAQIAVLGRTATNMHRLVAQLHVARARVSV